MEELNLLGQKVIAHFLADQGQQLPDGIVDQSALFRFVHSGHRGDRRWLFTQLQLLERISDQTGGNLSTTGGFDGMVPSLLGLRWGQADQRANLGLVLGFLLTRCQQTLTRFGIRFACVLATEMGLGLWEC